MGQLINNKNICAKISLLCLTAITTILTIDFSYELMPFNIVFLLLYVITILFLTIWISFVGIQHVLNKNIPFDTNTDGIYSKLVLATKSFIADDFMIPTESNVPTNSSIDGRIEAFVGDIERLFIRKWYVAYVSHDETFLGESRHLLDIIVRRFLQISEQINSDKLVHGGLVILLKHVKEYRRTVKKVASVGGSVETQYRYSHLGSKNPKAYEHFAMQTMSKVLRHFINWELYNSLACRCVTSVLSRKLMTYLLNHLSSPGFINYRIVERFGTVAQKQQLMLEKYSYISISDIDHAELFLVGAVDEEVVDEVTAMTPKKCTADDEELEKSKELDEIIQEINELEVLKESTTPLRVLTESVKIHESRSTNKTWRNSSDLDCISLGQDILYLSDMTDSDNLMDKKLWKHYSDSSDAEEAKPLPVVKEVITEGGEVCFEHHSKSNVPHFLRPSTTGAATLITNTIKHHVTANTMKEIQISTVNNVVKPVSQATSNAMHKIGDLQDEAAGVVEGILDFGMAGLRKGLRLTGLQDNIQDSMLPPKSAKRDIPKTQKLAKTGHVNSETEEVKKDDSLEDTVWVNPLMKSDSSPNFDGEILLEKSPMTDSRSFSTESSKTSDIPTMEIVHVADSPDPEYEDTTDLATTTAKLRSLLAQKTSESTLTTPTASPMSLIPTPLDPSGSSIEELSDVDGALPSMYKAWAKTATGVLQNTLNTIKTALPGNEGQQGQGVASAMRPTGLEPGEQQWMFVQSDPQPDDLSTHIEKFLAERQVFCMVDNAYEAVEAVEIADQLDNSLLMAQRRFDDELDDFDATIPMTKALVDLICELVEDTYPPLVKESIVKVLLLTTGRILEEKLHNLGESLLRSINAHIGPLPKFDGNAHVMPAKMNVLVEVFSNIVPGLLQNILNEECIKSVMTLLLESLQSYRINWDTNLQLLELVASEVIAAASQNSPTFSA